MSASVILVPQLFISIVSWLQLIFSINRYRGPLHFSRLDLWGLIIFLHAAFVRWITALSTHNGPFLFQTLMATIGATLSWISFVVVFNQSFHIPTRQQWTALALSILITFLWEFHNRLMIDL